jgi:hypothetical protein
MGDAPNILFCYDRLTPPNSETPSYDNFLPHRLHVLSKPKKALPDCVIYGEEQLGHFSIALKIIQDGITINIQPPAITPDQTSEKQTKTTAR